METVPEELRTDVSSGGAPGATAHPRFSPNYTPIEAVPFTDLDAPTSIRLGLQRRAAANLRNHVLRAMRRFTVLLVADLASFYVVRELSRAVRAPAVLRGGLAAALP